MIDKEHIATIVNGAIHPETEFIVDISVTAANRITVLLDSDEGISIDRCVAVSRTIEKALDREREDFELEVSSAGITSPLKMVRQYKKNISRSLDVVMQDGTKQTGKLVDVSDDHFSLLITQKVKPEGAKRPITVEDKVSINFNEVKTARIVISYK